MQKTSAAAALPLQHQSTIKQAIPLQPAPSTKPKAPDPEPSLKDQEAAYLKRLENLFEHQDAVIERLLAVAQPGDAVRTLMTMLEHVLISPSILEETSERERYGMFTFVKELSGNLEALADIRRRYDQVLHEMEQLAEFNTRLRDARKRVTKPSARKS